MDNKTLKQCARVEILDSVTKILQLLEVVDHKNYGMIIGTMENELRNARDNIKIFQYRRKY